MQRTLDMVFRNTAGKEVTISLPDPKDPLTLAEIQPVMDLIIAKNIFEIKGLTLAQVVEARIRTTDTSVVA